MYFSLFLLLSTMGTPRHYIQNKYKKTPSGGETKADQIGTLGSEKRHDNEFSGFSFCLTDSKLAPEKASNPTTKAQTNPNQ